MNLVQHMQRALDTFDESFAQVHLWIDEYYERHPESIGIEHRRKRHHWEGIEYVRKTWGEKAMYAAIQHVLDDIQQCILSATIIDIPKNEDDFIKDELKRTKTIDGKPFDENDFKTTRIEN